MIEKNIKKFYPFIFILLFWFYPPPDGLNIQAFRIFIIFSAVIFSLLLQTLPMAVSVLFGLTLSILTQLIPLKTALAGYSDSTTWLVVNAFLIAGVVISFNSCQN